MYVSVVHLLTYLSMKQWLTASCRTTTASGARGKQQNLEVLYMGHIREAAQFSTIIHAAVVPNSNANPKLTLA